LTIDLSFKKIVWKPFNFDKRQSLLVSQRYGLNVLLSKLLVIRNIQLEEIDFFLNPELNKILPDPFILKDMEKSVKRIFLSIKNKEKIGIISDYDVDGSSSAAIIVKFLKLINIEYFLEIPDRINEGYGPNNRILDKFKKNNIKLILSLDCGTNSNDIFNKNNINNIDVIIFDHHISESNNQDLYALVNPNRSDEKNNLKNLAAVGVTFLMLVALRRELRNNDYYKNNNLNEHNLTSYLDLVALGTVCDVVNLTHLNRAYVQKGMQIIYKRNNKGISSLIDISNIRRIPNAFDLAFIIGPKLNAAGRIGESNLSSKILFSNDYKEIESISRKLHLLNEKRKLIEENILNEAKEQAYKQNKNKVIIVSSENWHPGVIGIVASRILDQFNKPVIVISKNNSEGTGSARSLYNIDLGSLIILAKEKGILLKGGGHKYAAGLKIKNSKIIEFSDFLEKNINYDFSIDNHINFYDSIISIEEINQNLLDDLESLEPFGKGNDEPKFLIKNLKIDFIKVIKDKHISMKLSNNLGSSIQAISFNSVETILGDNLINSKNELINVIATIKRDNFTNKNRAQLIINDASL